MPPSGPVNIVYIVGVGHSGSTLLDLVLGSHSQIESMGEVRHIVHSRMTLDPGRNCPCGARIKDCAYWNGMMREMNGPMEGDEALDAYHLFKAVLAMTGKSRVCDSSKHMTWLRMYLSRPDLFNVRIVHLVRDPRAVAYSRYRRQGAYYRLIVRSLLIHRAMLSFLRRRQGWVRVRYEDVARRPREELPRLMAALGFEAEEQQYRFSDRVHHTMHGNTMRWKKGQEIREDTGYLEEGALTPLMWRVGTWLAWPLLLAYGYPLRRSRARAAALAG